MSKKHIYLIFRVIVGLFVGARDTYAQGGYNFVVDPPEKYSDFLELANAIGYYVYRVALPIAVVVIIYAGIKFLMARGNASEVTEAKSILLWAVVGVAVIVIGSGFFCLVKSILGIPLPPSGCI